VLRVIEQSPAEELERPRAKRTLAGLGWGAAESVLQVAARRCGQWHERASSALLMSEFESRPDDIFIATYPRSGTTWLQMVLYQLLHGPDVSFQHINDVCPWFERGRVGGRADRERTLSRFERLRSPRIFKTHLPYRSLKNFGCRYVYAYRAGLDVARSNYHFVQHDEPDFATFFRRHFLTGRLHANRGSWFNHVAGWLENPQNRNVLVLRYEELRADIGAATRRLATFAGAHCTEPRLQSLLELCSFEAMKRHESKFDYMEAMVLENKRVTRGYSFLRNGGRAEPPLELSEEDREEYRRRLAHHRLQGP